MAQDCPRLVSLVVFQKLFVFSSGRSLDRGNSQYEVSATETFIRLQPDLWRVFAIGLESGTHAYESAFAVKWLIEECINNPSPDRSIAWLSWGPYLWADGLRPRSDGLIWERKDFEPDDVHTYADGALKLATMLLNSFRKTPQPTFGSSTHHLTLGSRRDKRVFQQRSDRACHFP